MSLSPDPMVWQSRQNEPDYEPEQFMFPVKLTAIYYFLFSSSPVFLLLLSQLWRKCQREVYNFGCLQLSLLSIILKGFLIPLLSRVREISCRIPKNLFVDIMRKTVYAKDIERERPSERDGEMVTKTDRENWGQLDKHLPKTEGYSIWCKQN